MIKLTRSLKTWIVKYYPEMTTPILFGHVECFTQEMWKEYFVWCNTAEAKQCWADGNK